MFLLGEVPLYSVRVAVRQRVIRAGSAATRRGSADQSFNIVPLDQDCSIRRLIHRYFDRISGQNLLRSPHVWATVVPRSEETATP